MQHVLFISTIRYYYFLYVPPSLMPLMVSICPPLPWRPYGTHYIMVGWFYCDLLGRYQIQILTSIYIQTYIIQTYSFHADKHFIHFTDIQFIYRHTLYTFYRHTVYIQEIHYIHHTDIQFIYRHLFKHLQTYSSYTDIQFINMRTVYIQT